MNGIKNLPCKLIGEVIFHCHWLFLAQNCCHRNVHKREQQFLITWSSQAVDGYKIQFNKYFFRLTLAIFANFEAKCGQNGPKNNEKPICKCVSQFHFASISGLRSFILLRALIRG
jgi:hypothetical protein